MPVRQEKVSVPIADGESVSGVLTIPARAVAGQAPGVLLAHGAGGGLDDPCLTYLQIFLAGRGYAGLRFNFPYRERNRKVPDREDVLERTVQGALAFLSAQPAVAPQSIFLGGKSMGGRISSHLAARGTKAAGLLLLAYPLHAPGRPDRVRDQHLPGIRMPVLFVSGTRDALAPQASLEEAAAMPSQASVRWIEGGDHSFKMLRSSGKRAEDVWLEISEAAADWLDDVVQGRLRLRRTRKATAAGKTSARVAVAAKKPAPAAPGKKAGVKPTPAARKSSPPKAAGKSGHANGRAAAVRGAARTRKSPGSPGPKRRG